MTVLDKIWIAVLVLFVITLFVWGSLFAMAQVKVETSVPKNPCNECLRICNQLK